jgi:hypothetical protein
MITNVTRQVVSAFNAIPEIKEKKTKSFGSGMMTPLLKKSQTTPNKMEKEPAFKVAKMYQRIRRDRMDIKGMRNNDT